MTKKLSQDHFLQLINVVRNHHKRSPELTWSQAFMAVYRHTVDKKATNAKLLGTVNTADAFAIARQDYMEG